MASATNSAFTGNPPSGTSLNLSGLAPALPQQIEGAGWQTVSGSKRRRERNRQSIEVAQPVTEQQVLEAIEKAKAFEARMERECKRQRTEADAPETTEPMFVTEGNTEMIDVSGTPPHRWTVDYKSIKNPKSPIKVALLVKGVDVVVGGAFDQPHDYTPLLYLDGGRYGQRSVRIRFRISKTFQDKAVSADPAETYDFTLQWKFNVPVGQDEQGNTNHMVQEWSHGPVELKENSEEMVDVDDETRMATIGCPPNAHQRITMMSLTVMRTRISEGSLPPGGATQDEELAATIEELTDRSMMPVTFKLWFSYKTNAVLEDECLRYIQQATKERIPPLSQYYNDSGKLELSIKSTPSLKYIGGGMYIKNEKDGQVKSFQDLPMKERWDYLEEMYIYNTLTVVREGQWVEEMTASLSENILKIYIIKILEFTLSDKIINIKEIKIITSQKRMQNQFYVFIRLPVTSGEKESAPPEGTRIMLDADNQTDLGKHLARDPHDCWHRVVVTQPKSVHDRLGTDFCINMFRPRGAPEAPHAAKFGNYNFLDTRRLWKVWLHVMVDHVAAERERTAVRQFFEGDPPSGPASILKEGLFKDNWPKPAKLVDLTRGPNPKSAKEADENTRKYFSFLDSTRTAKDNPAQIQVLQSARTVPDGIQIVKGVPDSGKTNTLVRTAWCLRAVEHRVLICTPSNAVLDHNAKTLYAARPDGDKTKFLRLETSKLETTDITGRAEILEDTDLTKPIHVKERDILMENNAYKAAIVRGGDHRHG